MGIEQTLRLQCSAINAVVFEYAKDMHTMNTMNGEIGVLYCSFDGNMSCNGI